MTPLLLAALLQAGAALPMIEEVPVPLTAVEVKEGETKVIHLVPEAEPAGQEPQVSILAGAQVGFATEAENAYEPFVRVHVDVPLAKNPTAPSLLVNVELGGLQGAAVEIESLETWKTLEVGLAGRWYPVERLNVALWGEVGFASRRAGELQPQKKAPRWFYGGVILDRFKVGSLAVGAGTDQRLDGTYVPTATVKGHVKLYQATGGPLKGVLITLVGEAVLGLNLVDNGTQAPYALSDMLRAGLGAGWGTRK